MTRGGDPMMRLSAQAPVTHMLSSSEKFQIISCSQLRLHLFARYTKVTNSHVIQTQPKSLISKSNKERRCGAKHFQVYFKEALAISQHLFVCPCLPQESYFSLVFPFSYYFKGSKKRPAASQHPWSLGTTTRIRARRPDLPA